MGKEHRLLRALARKLELPSSLLLGDPEIELGGRWTLTLHRHRGIACYDESCVRIPMRENLRSLNLSNAAAVGVYEVLRQAGFRGEQPESAYFL